jgi:hypothetical protein
LKENKMRRLGQMPVADEDPGGPDTPNTFYSPELEQWVSAHLSGTALSQWRNMGSAVNRVRFLASQGFASSVPVLFGPDDAYGFGDVYSINGRPYLRIPYNDIVGGYVAGTLFFNGESFQPYDTYRNAVLGWAAEQRGTDVFDYAVPVAMAVVGAAAGGFFGDLSVAGGAEAGAFAAEAGIGEAGFEFGAGGTDFMGAGSGYSSLPGGFDALSAEDAAIGEAMTQSLEAGGGPGINTPLSTGLPAPSSSPVPTSPGAGLPSISSVAPLVGAAAPLTKLLTGGSTSNGSPAVWPAGSVPPGGIPLRYAGAQPLTVPDDRIMLYLAIGGGLLAAVMLSRGGGSSRRAHRR